MILAAADATTIATIASSAFDVIATVTVAIAGFYVILKLARRVMGSDEPRFASEEWADYMDEHYGEGQWFEDVRDEDV